MLAYFVYFHGRTMILGAWAVRILRERGGSRDTPLGFWRQRGCECVRARVFSARWLGHARVYPDVTILSPSCSLTRTRPGVMHVCIQKDSARAASLNSLMRILISELQGHHPTSL